MTLGMYIITGFAVLVGAACMIGSWRLVNKLGEEKPLNEQEDRT